MVPATDPRDQMCIRDRDKYDLVNWIFYVDFIERMDWSSCRNEWDMLEALCSHFYRERLFYQNALQVERCV